MRNGLVWIAMMGLAATLTPFASLGEDVGTIKATLPEDRAERRQRFEERNSDATLKSLADKLAVQLDLESPGVREGFARYYREGRCAEALQAYRDCVVNKLISPEALGIPSLCVEPHDPNPRTTSANGNILQLSVEDLMNNTVAFRGSKVDVGPPGTINWVFVPEGCEEKQGATDTLDTPDDHTGDLPMVPRDRAWQKAPADFARHFRRPHCFRALLAAYAETGKADYLRKWSEYIDDWCMNQKKDADRSPYDIQLYMPQEIDYFTSFLGSLAFVARNQPRFARDLPPSTLARVLLRYLPEAVAASSRQLAYFESNWRYFIARQLVTTGLLFPEFRISPYAIREGRRGFENSTVVCMLPDGSDYELTPNYWSTYLGWGIQPFNALAESGTLEWMTQDWRDELRRCARLRARASLAMLMPSGQFPIVAPQDLRPQLGEYDCGSIRETIPEFLAEPDNARRLNRAFGPNSPNPGNAVFGDSGQHVRARLLGEEPATPILDVTHTRQLILVKPAGVWIVVDRLDSPTPHEYSQLWMMHIPEDSDYGPIYGFTSEEVELDAEAGILTTHSPTGPNLTLHQIATAPLHMDFEPAPPNPIGVHTWTTQGRDQTYVEPGNYLFEYTISRLRTRWSGKGSQVLISVVCPGKDAGAGPVAMERFDSPSGTVGFDLETHAGVCIRFRAAAGAPAALRVGNVKARGESLLLVKTPDGKRAGLAIGCEQLRVGRKSMAPASRNAEFAETESGSIETIPIHTPIEPVHILPARNVFLDALDVTLESATPDVTFHYTLDGSEPTPDSPPFTAPIRITETTAVKARAFRAGVRKPPATLSGTDATVVSEAVFTKQAPRPATATGEVVSGLSYEYYEGEWQSLMLALDTLEPRKRGTVNEVLDVGPSRPDTCFAFRYRGFFEAPQTGVYTFFAPDPMYAPALPHYEPGYSIRMRIGGEEWYPATSRNAFGTWSVVLEKGKHPLEVTYVDFRGGKEDMYFPNKAYGCVWQGTAPELDVSGPGLAKAPLPAALLWRSP